MAAIGFVKVKNSPQSPPPFSPLQRQPYSSFLDVCWSLSPYIQQSVCIAVSWFGRGFVFVVLQLLGCVQLFATPYSAVPQVSLSFTITQSLLMTLESMMPSNHLILCHPPLLPPSLFPSIRVFSNKLALLIRWTKYWSFSYSISPSNEYLGLIFFRIDWFDLLAVQGTFQHHSSKSIDFSL